MDSVGRSGVSSRGSNGAGSVPDAMTVRLDDALKDAALPVEDRHALGVEAGAGPAFAVEPGRGREVGPVRRGGREHGDGLDVVVRQPSGLPAGGPVDEQADRLWIAIPFAFEMPIPSDPVLAWT